MGAALYGESGEGAYAVARSLTDEVGPRLAGSPGDARAVAWALAAMRAAGLANVRAEPVKVPRWLRGAIEEGDVVDGTGRATQRLGLMALGGSGPTGPGGAPLVAEVVEVKSLAELSALPPERVRGRIVLFNTEMHRGADGMANYGEVAPVRALGPLSAAKLGAVGALVRSLGVVNYRLPHTGAIRTADDVPRIPAAAVAGEDADLLHRLLQRGPVRVRLRLDCSQASDADSANVIGEAPGSGAQASEIVLVGAHLDSWDVGTGAQDDAAGVSIGLTALRALRTVAPARRTVRLVLFANEENGLRGAKTYAEVHAAELGRHVAALELDSGGGRPQAVTFAGPATARELLGRVIAPLRAIGIERVLDREAGGADLSTIEGKVPIVGLIQDTSRYFEWHHTQADTLDKLDRLDLNLSAAAVAVLLRGLADAPERLPLVPHVAQR